MDANPYRTIRHYLNATPGRKWGAMATSVIASVCLALLFPVLYLFADLIVWQGRVPAFHQLPDSQQEHFRQTWDAGLGENPDVNQILNTVRPPAWAGATNGGEWEWRWEAATYQTLRDRVGEAAATAYLPLGAPGASPTARGLGVLSLVVRERDRWSGATAGRLARWNPWMWASPTDGSGNSGYLTGLFLIGFVLALVRGIMLNSAYHMAASSSIDAVTRLRRALFAHGTRLGAVALRSDAQAEAGEFVAGRSEHIRDGLFADLTDGVRGPVIVVLLLVILLAMNVWMTISLLLLSAVVWLVGGHVAAWFRQDARRATRRAEARLRTMQEAVGLNRLAKSYLMERFSQNRFERQLVDVSKATWRRQRGEALSRPVVVTLASLAAVAMLYVAGRAVLVGTMSAAGLIVAGTAIGALVYATNRWLSARLRVARARSAAADVVEFLDRRGDAAQAMDAEFLPPMTKRLEFVDVSLREPGTGRMILENVTLSLIAGTRAAVVFSDTVEAEAVANLITRFADPTAGEVKIDGKNVRWVTYESVRTQVAVVLEQGLTFTDTVANNIGCGDPSFSLPQIIEAAKLAHAHQFVQRLPYGYETLIGDGGVSLKPGERFRVALARALLRDPSLLIIEEPAEPLDPDSWVLIDDTLARTKAGRTILFLARRPSTVRSADRVFVLHHGRLVATGSHDDLLASSELYRLLHFKHSLAAGTTS